MKKFLIVTLAALFCVAWTMPAMAKVEMEGMITTDVFYMKQSGERTGNQLGDTAGSLAGSTGVVQNQSTPDDGITELNIYPPVSNNRLRMLYHSDDKVLSGLIETRYGGPDNASGLDVYYAWLDWRPNDTFHLRVGRQPETFAIYAPGAAGMGYNDGFTLLTNFGNLHASSEDMVKAYVKFNDMIRMEFSLTDPARDNGEAPVAFPRETVNGVQAVAREEDTLPRIDISFPIKIGKLELEPSATWLRQSYDQVASGFEDKVDLWGVALGGKMGFGPLTISGEITYGQNLGDDSYTGAGSAGARLHAREVAVARAYDSSGDGVNDSIQDADYLGAWIQFDFAFGPATLQAAVGMEQIQSDAIRNIGEQDITRWGYAIALPISVAKGFIVKPNFIYHDLDDGALDGVNSLNNLTTDFGTEWLLGVAFQLTF